MFQGPLVRSMLCRLLVLLVLTSSECLSSENTEQLSAGRAINLFSRFGYLSISMKVVPRNDSEPWMFREPTIDVFEDIERHISRPAPQRRMILDGDFHLEFCDNLRQLLQAYFRDFTFEELVSSLIITKFNRC